MHCLCFAYLAFGLAPTAEVSWSQSRQGHSAHPLCNQDQDEGSDSYHHPYLWPNFWKVLKRNWGPIQSRLAGPMWVTISTCDKTSYISVHVYSVYPHLAQPPVLALLLRAPTTLENEIHENNDDAIAMPGSSHAGPMLGVAFKCLNLCHLNV